MERKIFNNTLKVFLLLSPLFTFKAYQVSFARGLFFITGSLLLYGASLSLSPIRKFKNVWLSIFFALALMRAFFDGGIGNGEYFNFWMAFSGFIYVFCGILLFHTVYCHVDNFKQFLMPIVFVCTANLVLTLSQVLGYDFMWYSTHELGKFCGFMETPAQLGQYSAMTAPLLFLVNPFLVIIPITTLLISKSVSPILSLFVGLGFAFITKKIYVFLLALILLVGVMLNIDYVKTKAISRPSMWEATANAICKKPYLGWGYRSFNRVVIKNMGKVGKTVNARAYNDYLHTAQELGLPTLLAGLIFLFGIFKNYLYIKRDKVLTCLMMPTVIILFNMLGQSVIRYASISGTFIVLLALFCIEINKGVQVGNFNSNM